MLDFSINIEDDVVVIALQGQLDALTAGKLKPVLDELLESDRVRVVYDLRELTLIDSSGVGVIVSTFKRTRTKGGDTNLAGMDGQPKEVFTVLNFHRYIKIFDTVEEAISDLAK